MFGLHIYIHVHVQYTPFHRYGIFDVENRCFVTFRSDPLTVPLPNNSYQIYYTPNNALTSKNECVLCTCMMICMYTNMYPCTLWISVYSTYIHVHVHLYVHVCLYMYLHVHGTSVSCLHIHLHVHVTCACSAMCLQWVQFTWYIHIEKLVHRNTVTRRICDPTCQSVCYSRSWTYVESLRG